uniref:NADH-ubiquinone oxidoreductase chain 2 n=1 Tax=Triops australiensis TaxID=89892 RepID=A0A068W6Z1_9CRUS|nr:NADH dehydrogenase subunit 2 [Triops australiensis]CDR98435.1 NADH dehydrogenase subunit 2 [Triops australiensis]
MFFNPRSICFFSLLILSTMIVISSNSWFCSWIGLELNVLSFIPIILNKNNQQLTEASVKYFLIQALASVIFLSNAIMNSFYFLNSILFICLITVSLLLKLGASPFHMWFPMVAEGLPWNKFLILATIQKINPLLLLSIISWNNNLILIAALFSSMVGALGGLNISLLRSMMAFSSINHIGWLLMASMISNYMMWLYFIIYTLILLPITQSFNNLNLIHLNQMTSSNNFNSLNKSLVIFNMLSLGGLPPFLGFLPKWIIIKSACSMFMISSIIILIMSTLITLYYYIRISYNSMLISNNLWSKNSNYKIKFSTKFMSFISMFGLMFSNWFI